MFSGSLPRGRFKKLKRAVERRGIAAMECQACGGRPDDARFNKCGHLYCSECYERVPDSLCERQSCRKRLRRATAVDDVLFESLCTRFGVFFALQSYPEEDTGTDTSDDSSAMQTPRATRFRQVSTHDQIISPQSAHFPSIQPVTASYDDNSSEDDGFDNRSQRSTGYGDDGDSFVSEDESLGMEDNFETDRTSETDSSTGDEGSVSIDSEDDGIDQLSE